MQKYTNFGEQGNTPALDHVDRLAELRAMQLSRETGISYHFALAHVLAHAISREAHNG